MLNPSKANDDGGMGDSTWPPAVKDYISSGGIAVPVTNGASPAWRPLAVHTLWSCLGLASPFVLLVPLICLQVCWLTILANNDGDARAYHFPTIVDTFETWDYVHAFLLAICGVILLIVFRKLINKNRLTAALFFFGYSVSVSVIAVFHDQFTVQLVGGLR